MTLSKQDDGTYKFTMPAADVTVTAKFKTAGGSVVTPAISEVTKTVVTDEADVPEGVTKTGINFPGTDENGNVKAISAKVGDSVTLLYKIKVQGNSAAGSQQCVITDEGATLVPQTGASQAGNDITVTLDSNGSATVYVTRTFENLKTTDTELTNTAKANVTGEGITDKGTTSDPAEVPVTVTDNSGDTETTTTISKSKTAKWVDGKEGDTAEVTLSLPADSYNKTIDVVLVVDNGFSSDFTQASKQARTLLTELEKYEKLKVNVGLVMSGGYVPVLNESSVLNKLDTEQGTGFDAKKFKGSEWDGNWNKVYVDALPTPELKSIKDENYLNSLNTALTSTIWKAMDGRKGSNIQAGILRARELLKNEDTASNSDKYIVLISDGGAFAWYNSDTQWSENGAAVSKYYGSGTGNGDWHVCNPYDFTQKYTDDNPYSVDFSVIANKAKEAIDAYAIEPVTVGWPSTTTQGTSTRTQYDYGYQNNELNEVEGVFKNGSVSEADTVDCTGTDWITTREAALWHTAQTIKSIKNGEEANVIFVSLPYKSSDEFTLTENFKQWLENEGYVSLYRVNATSSDSKYPDDYNYEVSETTDAFKSISDELVYLIGAGSTVTDVIGEDFDLVDVNTFKLTVDGTELTGTVEGNTVHFGDAKTVNGKDTYQYVVTYDSDKDSFTWIINEPVTKAGGVQLTYQVKLVNKEAAQTVNKTYTVDTNQSATLDAKDSNGDKVVEENNEFPKPTVDYTVPGTGTTPVTPSGGGSSGGGGDSGYAPGEGPLANKTDAELDTENHEAYVYGYPDGTVQPTGNITREEVATIFFRLLTDSSRAKYITSENPFPDVENDRWSHWSITTLNNAGIMTGRTDGTFDPAAPITRAELAVVASQFSQAVYNGEDKFSDITNHWARDYINDAASEGWVAGYPDGTFGPDRYITRAEVMTLINEVLGRMPDADNMLSSMIDWPDNPESAWYYEDVQEATNSHDYNWITNSSGSKTGEDWVKIIDMRPYADLVNDALNG